ncbi:MULTISPECIES: hypothetical protein [Marinomonas]|nr:hypothetical protein [Marinomonas sp. KMM3893]
MSKEGWLSAPLLQAFYANRYYFKVAMKESLRKGFSFVLAPFEKGEEEYVYKPSHRKILIVIGLLFCALSIASLSLSVKFSEVGGVIPIVVFLAVGLVCDIVGFLGTERAVATIWKSK